MSKIDINKHYRTRDGREVIIHSVSGPELEMPVVASISNRGTWQLHTWAEDGKSRHDNARECDGDLIEVAPKWRGKIWVHPERPNETWRKGWFSSKEFGEADGWRLIEVEEVEP